MKLFITSDHHWFHAKIMRPDYADRPFETVENMDREMIWRWNLVVSEGDLVIHLGDIAFGNIEMLKKLRKELNGTIIIIKGSHDMSKKKLAEAGFIVGSNPMYIDKYILSHVPLADSQIPKGIINIHGHIHEKDTIGARINICVEQTNYYPIELKHIIKWVMDHKL